MHHTEGQKPVEASGLWGILALYLYFKCVLTLRK